MVWIDFVFCMWWWLIGVALVVKKMDWNYGGHNDHKSLHSFLFNARTQRSLFPEQNKYACYTTAFRAESKLTDQMKSSMLDDSFQETIYNREASL